MKEETAPPLSFLARHEFLIRRLHSLSGLVPVGAYMLVHLATNASVLNGPATFQKAVYQIHSLGKLLPLVEWGFIFLPILFHAIFGVVIIRGGLPNNSSYPYAGNLRYTLQRASGMIAFLFILVHVFHLHGWFHFSSWVEHIAVPLGGARFKPYNAASTLGYAMSGFVWPAFYAIGVLSCVYHLANGIWTMGITWGVWVSPAAQARANVVCAGFGLILTVLSVAAWWGAVSVDEQAARDVEDRMYNASVEAGELSPDPEKRYSPPSHQEAAQAKAGGGQP